MVLALRGAPSMVRRLRNAASWVSSKKYRPDVRFIPCSRAQLRTLKIDLPEIRAISSTLFIQSSTHFGYYRNQQHPSIIIRLFFNYFSGKAKLLLKAGAGFILLFEEKSMAEADKARLSLSKEALKKGFTYASGLNQNREK
jgi:hypothetical protein